ncbi:MAG: cytochrome oxidase small assembly protein [Casimicrobiaceae bacterium]
MRNGSHMHAPDVRRDDAQRLRHANVRVALILASVAVAFFAGAIVARYIGGLETGMSILGLAGLILLVVALTRNVRDR